MKRDIRKTFKRTKSHRISSGQKRFRVKSKGHLWPPCGPSLSLSDRIGLLLRPLLEHLVYDAKLNGLFDAHESVPVHNLLDSLEILSRVVLIEPVKACPKFEDLRSQANVSDVKATETREASTPRNSGQEALRTAGLEGYSETRPMCICGHSQFTRPYQVALAPSHLLRLDGNVASHPLRTTAGLVQHDPRVRQREPLPRLPSREEEGAHGRGLAHANGVALGLDVLHGVIDG